MPTLSAMGIDRSLTMKVDLEPLARSKKQHSCTLRKLTPVTRNHNGQQLAYYENESPLDATVTELLRNKGCDGSDNSRANKNRLYVQTDIRRLRRTTRFEHNDRNDAQTRSCPRKRE
jgi:hypothetical protein